MVCDTLAFWLRLSRLRIRDRSDLLLRRNIFSKDCSLYWRPTLERCTSLNKLYTKYGMRMQPYSKRHWKNCDSKKLFTIFNNFRLDIFHWIRLFRSSRRSWKNIFIFSNFEATFAFWVITNRYSKCNQCLVGNQHYYS